MMRTVNINSNLFLVQRGINFTTGAYLFFVVLFFFCLISHLRKNWLRFPKEGLSEQQQQQQKENPVSCDLIQISTYILFTMYITTNQYEP